VKNRILFIALAVVMALSVGLVGCTGEEEEENAPYGTLIYAQEHLDKETFLGWWGSGYQNPWLMGPLYETLTFTDRTGNITPMLLTSWNMATNGTEWTLWVREGVKFQGTTWGNMTAADVKYSIERLGNIAGNDSQYRNAGKLKGLISNITTPETYKVVVSLTQPEAALLHLFGDVIQVVCKAYMQSVGDQAANDNPIGTGIYTKTAHVRGSYIELTLVSDWQNHWRVTGTGLPAAISLAPYPDFQKIRVVALPDQATRIQSLKSGLVSYAELTNQMVYALNTTEVDVVARGAFPDTDRIVFGGLDMVGTSYPRNVPTNPWYNVTVRKAMVMAINKTLLLNTLYYGLADPAGSITWAPEWVSEPPIADDPAQAVQLLNDAGYGGGFTVKIISDGRWMNTDLATVIANNWHNVLGINATVVIVTGGTHRTNWQTGAGGFNTSVLMHRAPGPGADAYPEYSSYLAPNGAICCYSDNTTQNYLTLIGTTLDWNQRSAYITQLGDYINQQVAVGFLFHVYSPLGYRTELDEPRNVARLFDYLDLARRK
jgi:ABC-type transport system substrate-binding protein